MLSLRRLHSLIIRIPITQNVRDMSVYAPYFMDPIFKKNKLKELSETGELYKFTGIPVKAPQIDETCSTYNDPVLTKFVNYVMREGRKNLARDLVEKAFINVKRKQIERYHLTTDIEKRNEIELDPLKVFHKALLNVRPLLELQPVRRGGVTYQVPIPVHPLRANTLSMKWIVEAAKDKDKPVHFPEKLAWELLDASENQGRVVKRKQDLHKQCEANRAYAHYRWS